MKLLLSLSLFCCNLILTSCNQNEVKSEINLSPEKKAEYTEKIQHWSNKIDNYEEKSIDNDERPPMDFFIEKARYQEYLGNINSAIKTLQTALDLYENSSVAWNNIAKLYEQKGKYKKSLKYYQKLVETFPDLHYYTIDMIKMQVLLKNKTAALNLYNQYKKDYQYQDAELYSSIQNLK